jgi:hypothetical protein
MCTYTTEIIPVHGSGKINGAWQRVDEAAVYFDHPVHFPAGHSLMIDVRSSRNDSAERVALELDATSARALAEAILATLDQVPPALRADSHVG